VVVLQ
jgi:hypothetical protein